MKRFIRISKSQALLILCAGAFLGANSGLAMAQSNKMTPVGNVVRLPTTKLNPSHALPNNQKSGRQTVRARKHDSMGTVTILR